MDPAQLMPALDWYVRRISADRDLLTVVLHGSLAAGEHTGGSDVDLLIVLEDSEQEGPESTITSAGLNLISRYLKSVMV